MSDAVLLAIIATIQAVATGIISIVVKTNACGGEKCLAMFEQLKRAERTPGTVAVSGKPGEAGGI
jgi:hypothetical protein